MIFVVGAYTVDIDVERTRRFYNNAGTAAELCPCGGCRNFDKAVDAASAEAKERFTAMGIDMHKPRECYVNCALAGDRLLYAGFYHVCGRLLAGESAWKLSEDGFLWDDTAAFWLDEEFRISFSEDIALVETCFPRPVIQMDFLADMPYRLKGKNPYII